MKDEATAMRSNLQKSVPMDQRTIFQEVVERLALLEGDGTPKHVRLRNALFEMIKLGILHPGDQIPPERDLSAAINLSLGTVQRSLGKLAAEGTLVRRHGMGTFVAEIRKPSEKVWQFRFFDPDGIGPLSVYPRLVACESVASDDRLRKILGFDAQGYCKISRRYIVGDLFTCFGEFFVCNSEFEQFAEKVQDEKESVSFKVILDRDYFAPTLSVKHWVRSVSIPYDIARHMDIAQNAYGLLVEVIGFSHRNRPISFQRIHVPPTDYLLDMSHQVFSEELKNLDGNSSLYSPPSIDFT